MFRTRCGALSLCLLSPFVVATPVSLSVDGMDTTLDNGLLKATFNPDGSARALVVDGVNLVSSLSGSARDPSRTRSAYLDYHSNGVKDFKPQRLDVVSQTADMAHIAWIDEHNGLLRLEYHLIMRKGIKGIYSYVVAENNGQHSVKVSELRNVYRFNPTLLDHLYSGERTGQPERYAALEQMPKIQDETWRLPDGSVYSKYDFAGYQRMQPFWGVYGADRGVWLIHASGEYLSGDTLKQDLLVHQDAIILNYMTGAHFGTPDMMAPPGWKKLYGPWLLYVNDGSTADARRQAFSERVSWPYRWLDDSRYVTQRTTVSGRVTARVPVEIQLSSSRHEAVDQQTLGYVYSTLSDAQGEFSLAHVPPGEYKLTATARGGVQAGYLLEKQVTVSGNRQSLGEIALPSPAPVVWAIGIADRTAAEFRFGNEKRNFRWQQAVPASLTFDTVNSDYRRDWYYAQTRPGTWKIAFTLRPDKPVYQLNIALAAASNNGMQTPATSPALRISINGKVLETLRYDNDKTLYRGALQSGRYHAVTLSVPAERLHTGSNSVSLELLGGAVMYDVISLTEAPSPAADKVL